MTADPMLDLLVIGATGQVARELARAEAPGVRVRTVGRETLDLSDPEAAGDFVRQARGDLVVNAAAYTAVDKAESEPELAMRVNGEAPGAMAAAARARGVPFLHISTDYVFDGSGDRPWREGDPTGPLGVYGRTKLAGEAAVAAAGGDHAILRTAWVFSAHGGNFVKTMLRVGRERDRLTVVDDQTGGPTGAADIAAALLVMARAFGRGQGVTGVFHFCGAPAVTWRGFAAEIFRRSGWPKTPEVAPIRTEEWPTPAARPRNSTLDCQRILECYDVAQPAWTDALDRVLSELEGMSR